MTIERIEELLYQESKSIEDYERLKSVRAIDRFELYCLERHKDIFSCLKELQANREAWEKAIDAIKAYQSRINTDNENCKLCNTAMFGNVLYIMEECRPKEGESE